MESKHGPLKTNGSDARKFKVKGCAARLKFQTEVLPAFLNLQQESNIDRSTKKRDISASIVIVAPVWSVSQVTTAPDSNRCSRPEIGSFALKG